MAKVVLPLLVALVAGSSACGVPYQLAVPPIRPELVRVPPLPGFDVLGRAAPAPGATMDAKAHGWAWARGAQVGAPVRADFALTAIETPEGLHGDIVITLRTDPPITRRRTLDSRWCYCWEGLDTIRHDEPYVGFYGDATEAGDRAFFVELTDGLVGGEPDRFAYSEEGLEITTTFGGAEGEGAVHVGKYH